MKLLALVSLFAAVYSPVAALWPQPRTINTGNNTLRLAPNFQIIVSGHGVPSDVQAAVGRTQSYLAKDKLARLVVGRGASDAKSFAQAKTLSKLTVSLEKGAAWKPITSEAQKAPADRDEAYHLTVPADGSAATLTANSTLGLLRGLTTFGQLWYAYDGTTYAIETPVTIEDSPAYPYRGFMLDTARNFFPVADIKRTLDAMSWVKLNQFHWHVVDSQSFPLEIPGFTDLAAKGAYSSSQVYSPSDVQDIVAYAGARGIDVMVEIDTPGHTAIIAEAHPDFVACPGATPWGTYANEPPAGQLRLANSTVTNYIADLFTAASELFPSTLFSTGGDELNTACYDIDEPTQAALNATGSTLEQALDQFTQVTHKALEVKGKTPAVWEEMVLVHNVTISKESPVLVWISSENVKAVAEKGFKIIHAASDYFYLDCGHGAWVGDFPTGNSWCDPFKSWQLSYSFNPTANLTTDEAALILGGQHLLWAEQSGPENLDDTIWPRAASSAELFWTGPGGNISTALPRLHDVSYRFRTRGVKTISLQPEWCALRPGACDLTA
ncbi:N-acetylhexosaminidase [Dichomitus squalens]|uniref:Beta-hexosaminidase n=2 Tax=Dichomitus squalens TaxID=114155 RepID=A0A4Q9NVY5_9APHY|nr:N-acetylhexosaminidase [Dichomitus squalens LYAD-421 SS1]EJF60954.1 N-acetylhexosaminidase [Dichomitus squalens LYAD-421 SS1]TBU45588.1 N-acetylhexosaminidase [Dichomitus squalens]TBU58067.1 N-acetylhexosaminidase [Dichomitus squalens]